MLGYLLGLICTVAVLLIAVYLREVYLFSRFEPTGDALFDRYGREVLKRQSWRLMWSSGDYRPLMSYVPADTLAGWEEDFGIDPRYWQLRYWCSVGESGTGLFKDDPGLRPEHKQYLLAGVTEVDGDLQSYCALTNYMLLTMRTTDDGEQLSADGEKELELGYLDEGVDRFPEEAWPYYLRALHHWRYGDRASFMSDLRAGNASPSNTWPFRVFPEGFVHQYLQDDELPGNPALCGLILIEACHIDPSLHYFHIKEMSKEIATEALESGSSEPLVEFHGFLSRIWSARGVDDAAMTWASEIDRDMILAVVMDERCDIPVDQRNRMFAAALVDQKLYSTVRSLEHPYFKAWPSSISPFYAFYSRCADEWITYGHTLNGRSLSRYENWLTPPGSSTPDLEYFQR